MTRPINLIMALAAASATMVACNDNSASPTETVRLAVISGAAHGGKPFLNHLTQEVTTVPVWSGDPDGTGTALITVNAGQREICWETTVSDIMLPATASHIHHADAGIRGPIVVALSAPDATGLATGCRPDVDSDLLRDILQNPSAYYVNVHTTDFPAGAIRAQMAR